jgi:hypothetical protein
MEGIAGGFAATISRPAREVHRNHAGAARAAEWSRFECIEGRASIADGYNMPDVSSKALLGEYQKVISEYAAASGRPLSHMQDFLACVKSRRQTMANPEVMHRSMTTCHAVNICLALKRDLQWDPAKEEFVGDPEANRMRSRAMREPWRL